MLQKAICCIGMPKVRALYSDTLWSIMMGQIVHAYCVSGGRFLTTMESDDSYHAPKIHNHWFENEFPNLYSHHD